MKSLGWFLGTVYISLMVVIAIYLIHWIDQLATKWNQYLGV